MRGLRLLTVLDPGAAGEVSLPWEVLWALSLNPGDLVAARREASDTNRYRLRSYGQGVRTAIESCDAPWPYVEELLRQPLGAVGLAGSLNFEGFGPGEPLALEAAAGRGDAWFTLERSEGKLSGWALSALARYRLEVEPGFKVLLPADALYALSLAPGSAVGYTASMWFLEGWPADERPAHGRLEIGPSGTLPLPQKLREYAALKPRSPVRLEVSLSTRHSSFRLEPDLS